MGNYQSRNPNDLNFLTIVTHPCQQLEIDIFFSLFIEISLMPGSTLITLQTNTHTPLQLPQLYRLEERHNRHALLCKTLTRQVMTQNRRDTKYKVVWQNLLHKTSLSNIRVYNHKSTTHIHLTTQNLNYT
jgi:hypothetical protein